MKYLKLKLNLKSRSDAGFIMSKELLKIKLVNWA